MKFIVFFELLVVSIHVRGDAIDAESEFNMEEEIWKLKEATTNLQRIIAEQNTKIADQGRVIMEQNMKIANQDRLIMEHRMNIAVNRNTFLQNQNGLIERSLSSMEKQNAQYQELLSQIDRLHTLNETFLQFVESFNAQSANQGFAFYAYLSENIGPLDNLQTIIYNEVVTDTSNAYDLSSGVLTIPLDGVYEIGMTIKAQSENDATAEIAVNNNSYCSAYIVRVPDFRTESNQVILTLRTGDKVSCRTRENVRNNFFYGNRHMYNNFYVKLIYQNS